MLLSPRAYFKDVVYRYTYEKAVEDGYLVEVKRPGMGLASARRQGAGYAESHQGHGIPVLATNGFAWKLYTDLDHEASLSAFLPEPSRSALPFFDALISCLRDILAQLSTSTPADPTRLAAN